MALNYAIYWNLSTLPSIYTLKQLCILEFIDTTIGIRIAQHIVVQYTNGIKKKLRKQKSKRSYVMSCDMNCTAAAAAKT